MRTRYFGFRFHLGPFYAGEVWRFRKQRRRRVWTGELPGWRCPHQHRSQGAAIGCAQKEERRRARGF